MPKRWVTAPVVGTGTKADPWRASITGAAGLNYRASIPLNMAATPPVPKFGRCLVLVWGTAAALQAAATANPQVRVLPPGLLNSPLSELTAGQRTTLRTIAEEVGFDYQGQSYTNATLLRRVIRDLGRFMDPAFDENAYETPALENA